MREHGLEWARSRTLVTTEAEASRLDAARFDRLTAYAYPDARGAGADLAVEWMFWFFPFDDWFDSPLGHDHTAVRGIIDSMIHYVHGDPSDMSRDAPSLISAFTEIFDRSGWGMSAAWRFRFAEDLGQYLFANYIEAFYRAHGVTPDLDTIADIRRHAIGLLPSLDFGESACRFQLAAPITGSEPFHRMRIITAEVLVCVNEAFSLGKDLANEETNSGAVVLMRTRGWSPEQTIHFLEDTVAELTGEYLTLESTARTQAQRFGLPEEKANVDSYLQSMRDWMIGNLEWSRETQRYAEHIPPSWKTESR